MVCHIYKYFHFRATYPENKLQMHKLRFNLHTCKIMILKTRFEFLSNFLAIVCKLNR